MLADAAGDGDMLADGVTGADVLGVAATEEDVTGPAAPRGMEVADEVIAAGMACPERAPGGWCATAVRAKPPAADAARSPVTMEAIASGRHRPRRCRPPRRSG
jgi:hypothetical protein